MYPGFDLSAPKPRRGVLLLVVLSMLTLFIMLGTAYIVTATRAKETARAYARLTFGGDEARVPHARIADMVLLEVLRGGGQPPTGPVAGLAFESILADKYGAQTLYANVSVVDPAVGDNVPPPVLTVSATLVSGSARPTDLNGRVLTFAAPGRPATSHRILRAKQRFSTNASGTAFTLSVDGPRRSGPWTRPLPGRAIINGREFAGVPATSAPGTPSNEAWDGFDDHNPFLAQVGPGATISTTTVSHVSFYPSLTGYALTTALAGYTNWIPNGADNDNDGVPDGLFLDFGIPSVTDAGGNVVDIRASVLVVDLDSRFNVNAHGSLAPILYSSTNTNWTSAAAVTAPLSNSPIGSGYGPAEIQANSGFRNEPKSASAIVSAGGPRIFDSGTLQSGENPRWTLTVGASANALKGQRPSGSRYSWDVSALTPRIGALEAKYGEKAAGSTVMPDNDIQLSGSGFRFARPGEPDVDDEISRINDRRAFPAAGPAVNFGIPSRWWNGRADFDWSAMSGTIPAPRGIFNSPPDLHGRMKTVSLAATGSSIAPQIAFAQPEWSGTGSLCETKDDPYEVRLDTRLGFGGWLHDPMTDGIAPGAFDHNPFTPAELEPVLRPYDIDTNRLPPRLAAMLGSAAEESRLKITTDSWDTTAITGSAAILIFGTVAGGSNGWLQQVSGTHPLYGTAPAAAASGVIGGEVSRGEKFDLNRALAASGTIVGSGTSNAGYSLTSEYVVQRQAYFKDLYTLLVALAPAADRAALAQWAANVVEFRDADSRVIPFEYDENPLNGWQDADGSIASSGTERKVVWGAERPEILIREAFAWRNAATGAAGMAISLHRPWRALAYATGTHSIDAEPCDHALDTLANGKPTNQIDLGKKAHPLVLTPGTFAAAVNNDVSGTSYPIWRLRLVAGGSTNYVRLDSGSAGVNEFILSPAITSGTDKPKLPTDSTLTLVSGLTIQTGTGQATGTASLTMSGSNRTVAGMRMPGTAATGTVYLERLSDPSALPTKTHWNSDPLVGRDTAIDPCRYLVVDAVPINVVDTSPVSVDAESSVRDTVSNDNAFWPPPRVSTVFATLKDGATVSFPPPLAPGNTAWMPWPNRPFVSAAELLLVPQGDALEILRNYRRLGPSDSGAIGPGKAAPVPLHLLLDAAYVPTRFAGIHSTTGSADLSAHGIYSGRSESPAATVTSNQLSSWREPGRVNLNTVVAEDVWNAVVAGPLAKPIKSSTAANLRTDAAQSLAALLSLASGTGGEPAPDVDGNLPAALNPLHGIYTATRLANTVTPRSNLFAVWITLRESVAGDPDSVRYRRAFYVVDRSIPVGYDPGRNHNVWDCVRVRRIIE